MFMMVDYNKQDDCEEALYGDYESFEKLLFLRVFFVCVCLLFA